MMQTIADSKQLTRIQIIIKERKDIRRTLLFTYKSLTQAAYVIQIDYSSLSDVLSGRRHTNYIIQALQKECNLTNEQVLEFWPLLGRWPKEDRRRIV